MLSGQDLINPGTVMWARSDLRRRWLSLVVLAVLAGLSAGLCMAALGGARRTDTAFSRLRAETHAADAVLFPSQVGVTDPDWTRLEAQPYVERVARWNLLFGDMNGQPGGLIFGPADDVWLNKVDRPVVVAGRMFDPHRADEVVMSEDSQSTGLHLGSTFRYRFFRPGTTDLNGEPPDGPELRFRVVGIVRQTSELLFTGMVLPSPGLIERYGDKISALGNAHVRLKDWRTGMPRLKKDATRLVAPDMPVLDLHQVEKRVSTTIEVERSALLLLALAVFAAGLVFVGQALARSVSRIEPDCAALHSVGFTRRDILAAAVLPHCVVAALGAVIGVGTAIAISPRFPIGLGRRVDPGVGVHLDLTVLVPGVLLLVALIIGGAALVAFRVDRPGGIRERRPNRLLLGVRSRLPLPVGLGTTIALESGSGRRSFGGRPALVGAMVGVLGLAGTLTVVHGLDDALTHPARVGVTWDAAVESSGSAIDLRSSDLLDHDFVRRILKPREVGAASVFWRVTLEANGVGVPMLAAVPQKGNIGLVTVAGRAPVGANEVAIGPATARQLGVDIGDTVTVSKQRLRIVGRALFPPEVHSGFDEGLQLSWPTMRALAPAPQPDMGIGPSPFIVVNWRRGVSPERGLSVLTATINDPSTQVMPAEVPLELTNLRSVRRVPLTVAAFLVFIAFSTLLHALVTTLRSRREEFAVLRALGFTRRMVGTVLSAQSSAVAAVGLVVGVPLGLAVGRWIWVWLASQVPLVYVSPLSIGLALLLIPATVVAFNLLALWPARRASRLRVSEVLRVE